jgi:hypothetical protein
VSETIETKLRAELAALSEPSATLVELALGLARRLDAEPGDDAAVRLNRELRMTLHDLFARTPEDGNDVERLLARIAAPQLGNASVN